MRLNDTGKRRLVFIFVICLAVLILWGIAYLLDWIELRLLGLVLIPLAFYGRFKKTVSERLQDQVFKELGLTSQLVTDFDIKKYTLSSLGKTFVDQVRSGKFNDQSIVLVYFRTEIGSGKNKQIQNYVGIEMTTKSNTLSMQLYDRVNLFRPRDSKAIELESVEFNNAFVVYVQNPTDAYYNLNPDTMAELMDLRNTAKHQINIEYMGDKVFVYTDLSHFITRLDSTISFTETLNDEHGPGDLEAFRESLTAMVAIGKKVFELLNIHPKEHNQKI